MKRWLIGLPLALLLLVIVAVAGSAWLFRSASGTAWLLAHLPGVQVEAPEGPLLGGNFFANRLVVNWGSGSVDLRQLRVKTLQLSFVDRTLLADSIAADVAWVKTQPSTQPAAAPDSLTLPLSLRVAELRVAELRVDEIAPLAGLEASLDAQRHGLLNLVLRAGRWQHLGFSGEVHIASTAPLVTDALLKVQPQDTTDLPWTATITARGPLAQLALRAELQAAHQALQADAQAQPFAAWPLSALQLRARSFDLAALHPDLPRTALTGEAQLAAPARDREASLRVTMTNASPGRWDAKALPLQRLQLALAARPDQPTSLRLSELDAELSGGARLLGQGRREVDGRWRLDAQLRGLRPEALDARAAAARLDGPFSISGGPDQPLNLVVTLDGTLQARPLQLRARVQGQGSLWRLDEVRLSSGDAELSVQGSLDTSSSNGSTELTARLRQFDPHLLWRGEPGSAWAKLPGPTALNADARLDIHGHSLALLTGSASATLLPSRLAGLALDGTMTVQRARAREAAALSLDARVGGSHIQGSGSADPDAVAARFSLQAATLAELRPLLALAGPAGIAGQAEGEAELKMQRSHDGWNVGSNGKLALTQASAAGLSLASAQAAWALPLPGVDGDSPLTLQVSATSLRHAQVPQTRLDRLTLDLQGRRSAHELRAQLDGVGPQGVTLSAQLQAAGRWSGNAWDGRIARLAVAPLRAGLPQSFAASDIGLHLEANRVEATTGRAEIGGAFVSWQQLSWQGGDRPQLRAELQLESLAAAPLLARWQPGFGWGGDLRVAGHASLKLDERLTAELLIERQGGDLHVTDELGSQPLLLTDLRLALNVNDGVWHFAEGLAGAQLGSLGAALTLRPTGLWPTKDTAMEGVLQANVAQLANWGRWGVPAGWRVGGRLAATVQAGGRLGAPELRGRAEGEGLALRHLLYGVDVQDGRFALELDGRKARLTQLEARGGDGWLRATGNAELGEKPNAQIELTVERMRLLSRVDRSLVASGQALLALDASGGIRLDGKLKADEGLFDFSRADAPALASDVEVLRGPRPADSAEPAAAPAPPRKTAVQLELDFGRNFRLRGRGLETRLRGGLVLAQHDGPLRVTGRLDARGGQYAAYGQKLEIERGDVTFTGALDNPALDLLAIRPNLDTRVGVQVSGTAQSPRVALYSEPDMADTDKLSWLLLGRGPDGLGRTDTALLQRAAVALLSGEGEGLTGRALKGIGLDELSLSQTDDDTRATIVRLGKQLSRRWYVGYERSLNATTGSWQLIYRIAQRFTLRAQSGDDNSLDLIWQWRWN